MVFSREDKIFIKNLVLLKGYSRRRLIKEFPQKGWNKNGLDVLLRKIRKPASVEHQPGNGRPRSVRTPENIDTVNDLVLMPCRSLKKSDLRVWEMSSDFFIFQQDRAPQHIEQRTPLRCCDVKHYASLDRNSGEQTHQTSIQLTTEFGV